MYTSKLMENLITYHSCYYLSYEFYLLLIVPRNIDKNCFCFIFKKERDLIQSKYQLTILVTIMISICVCLCKTIFHRFFKLLYFPSFCRFYEENNTARKYEAERVTRIGIMNISVRQHLPVSWN